MYGKASRIYTEREKDSLFVKTHVIELAGLLPGNCYYFVANGTDQSGNSAESSEYRFTTSGALKVFDTGTPQIHILQYQARTTAQSRQTKQLLPQSFTLTHAQAQAGIRNMLVYGTKHGTPPQPGTAMQATGITSPSTSPLFFYPTKHTTIPFAQARIHRFTILMHCQQRMAG